MLQRYLGNKSSLTGEILDVVRKVAPPGSRICDAFAGSLAVSFALRKSGFLVSANDINLLSWIYGTAYLCSSTLPLINLIELVGEGASRLRVDGQGMIDSTDGCAEAWSTVASESTVADWAGLVAHIFEPYKWTEVPVVFQETYFFDHYCVEGSKSDFKSSRGTMGRRRFLSAKNAAALDRAMSRIRYWHRTERIDEKTRCLLTAIVLDSVERVANIQGTYHDFPRDFYDPRALKPIVATLPEAHHFSQGPASDQMGKAIDSLEFVKTVPAHSVLYLDPPYNFRQYTSYYFLPNLIAEFPDIDDLSSYFAEVQFVRGQNMRTEFSSTFCSTTGFLPSLSQLVRSSECDYVVLSYFNGRNHWNKFKAGTDNRGREELEAFFRSEIFIPDSLSVHPVSRLNYQSYGGHKALEVCEYLFVAKKANLKNMLINEEEYAVV